MMGRPQKDVIDTFKSVTGASEAVALRKLEEHGGDLNAALNAHFSEGERANSRPVVVPAIDTDDIMDVDQPIDVETVGPSFPLLGDSRSFNSFSLLEEHMGRNSFRGRGIDDARSRAPRVLHPREVREIPIDFKDDSSHSGLSNHGPNIEYLEQSEYIVGPATFGHVTMDEEEEDHEPVARNASVPSQFGERYDPRDHDNIVPETSTSVVADNNDIEEEMIKAAIEASKLDAQRPPSPDLDVLNTTEQERTLDEGFPFDQISQVTSPLEELERKAKINSANNRRQETGASTSGTSMQILPENIDEQPLTRRNSRNTTARSTSKEAILLDDSPPSSPLARSTATYPQNNGAADEWGGMTSEEHDEAVMLEAAMFGGIPEREPYSIRSTSYYNTRANHPPSPTLAAERLLREQQDDEYQAALQADRERELKETAVREAALEKERTLEEEMQKRRLKEEEFERELTAKLASLPEEPSTDDENAMRILVRMPDGSRHGRRFLKSDKLQSLFDFIDSERVAKPKTYRLVRPYPRTAFGEEESGLSFGDLGMTSKQEALFLEVI